MKGTLALILGLAAFAVGTFVVLLILVVGNDGDGSKLRVSVGGNAAHAACTKKNTIECLPEVVFNDTDGNSYSRDKLNGKVVVVNFWATWCKPCKAEIPAITKVAERYAGKDVVILGVMTDEPDDIRLLNFASDHDLRYPVVRATQDVLLAFEYPERIPTTFIYDRSGNLRSEHHGAVTDSDLGKALDELLAEP